MSKEKGPHRPVQSTVNKQSMMQPPKQETFLFDAKVHLKDGVIITLNNQINYVIDSGVVQFVAQDDKLMIFPISEIRSIEANKHKLSLVK